MYSCNDITTQKKCITVLPYHAGHILQSYELVKQCMLMMLPRYLLVIYGGMM